MFCTKKRERTTRKQRNGPTRAAPLTRGLLCLVFTMGMLSLQQETRAEDFMEEYRELYRKARTCKDSIKAQLKKAWYRRHGTVRLPLGGPGGGTSDPLLAKLDKRWERLGYEWTHPYRGKTAEQREKAIKGEIVMIKRYLPKCAALEADIKSYVEIAAQRNADEPLPWKKGGQPAK